MTDKPTDNYPPLDSPALVGNTKFDTGVSSKLVVKQLSGTVFAAPSFS
ncbi:hypothetical protein WG219_11385 [Ectopseudomonas mendocina]|uniref:Uncharacterized protein n=1 Tax=Ectopseudomonas mendocina TaxID=300 RepID=A0ABZ2RD86_ECTME